MAQSDSTQAFVEDLSRIIAACRLSGRPRAMFLGTRDREHALNAVCAAAVKTGAILQHASVAGRRKYNPQTRRFDSAGGGVQDAAGLLRNVQEMGQGGVVLLEDCLPFLRDDAGDPRARLTLAQILMGEAASRFLVLVFMEPPEVESRLPGMLSDQFTRLSVPYPRLAELERIALDELAALNAGSGLNLPPEAIKREVPRLASGLVGLSRSASRDALADALAANPSDFDTAFKRLTDRKSCQLKRELAMNVLETDGVEEPVGLDYLMDYLKMQSPTMRIEGPSRSRGVLLIGPPGTGKTMLARAIGRLVALPVVEFRISSLMNSLLGETERRFAQAFATLEAMSPNVCFIDEIEKAFGDSSERDGGTMMRCTGSLLSWLSDNPYPNYIVATSNSLKRMGEIGLTMTRSERFDCAFFVDVPGRESRRKMLCRWLAGAMQNHEDAAARLAEDTEKFSGADLRSIVKQAKALAEYRQIPLNLEILREQALRKRMRALALYDEFHELRRWGAKHCDPAGPTES